jgi:hypothetical protein
MIALTKALGSAAAYDLIVQKRRALEVAAAKAELIVSREQSAPDLS